MKRSIAAILLLGTSFTANATTITVEGFGSDREAAKRDAFRTAIENVCGTVVLSDREHFNSNTVRDNIFTYSSCNVKSYTVIEESTGRVKVTVDVQPNRVSERLHETENNTHVLNQPNIEAQSITSEVEKSSADKIISEIFHDYPSRAYDLKSSVQVVANSNQIYYLKVMFDISWNKKFLNSVSEFTNTLKTKVYARSSKPQGKINIAGNVIYTNDLHKVDYIKEYFQNGLYIRVQARNTQGVTVIDKCGIMPFSTNEFYIANPSYYHDSDGSIDQLTIFGNAKKNGLWWVELKTKPTEIYDVIVSVDIRNNCKIIS